MPATPQPPTRPSQVSSTPPPSTPPLAGLNILSYGTLFVELIIAQVAMALGNIDVLGIHPLAFLTQWGQDLQNTASQAFIAANTAQTTASAATTVQSQQSIAKPGYLAGDSTADAVFPIAQISGPTPSEIAVTSAASVIGFIDTPDHGKKSSIIWLGQDTSGLTGFYINIYKLDTVTNEASLIEASVDILSGVSNGLAYNYYDLVTPITSQVGFVYAVEVVVTGPGTYHIAGLPSDWKPANTVAAYPQQLGSSRTSALLPAPATFTPTYTGTVPWFGLGGFAFAGPTSTEYNTAGAHTYTIPSWMKWGDQIDVLVLGDAGGGQASTFFLTGAGGAPGSWTVQTLVYGVDLPTTTTTLTVDVGPGGAGGSGAGAIGGNGTGSSVSGAGMATISAAGGAGGSSGGVATGQGPGNKTLHGITYTGGADAGFSAAGNAPGGGGGGGGPYSDGAHGAPGAVWLAAYQAGTAP